MATLKKCWLLVIALCFCLLVWPQTAQALITLDDHFVATDTCEAFQSIRRGTNPGNIRLTPETTYPVVGQNREEPSHYLLRIEGANPPTRWVSVDCGQLTSNPPLPVEDYLLAISWQPSFCETKPNKPECESQTAQRFDATHLVLHGLWPQPRQNIYCQVSDEIIDLDKDQRWSELPPIALSDETLSELAMKMPGFASDLHLHEWYKHGTCYSASPEEYFQESIALLDQINDSSVRDLFVQNIGDILSSREIRDQFDAAFFAGAGQKVQVQCAQDIDGDHTTMVVELQVNLRGTIAPETPVDTLLQEGQTVPAGCNRGEVDPAGI